MELFRSGSLPPELLAEIKRLHFQTKRLADEGIVGQYRSAFRGRGVEFEEVREYNPGDDIRTIDWKVTARSNVPFVKLFREERELTVMLGVDTSASTLTGSRQELRERLLAKAGALFTLIALRNNDKVGLVTFSDRIETYHPPRKARGSVWRILHEVLSPREYNPRTDLAGLCTFLSKTLNRSAIVFILSDFYSPPFAKPLSILAQKHDVTAVQVRDPWDVALPQAGLVLLRDRESGDLQTVDTSNLIVQREYRENQKKAQQELCSVLRRAGVRHIELRTDEPLIVPIRGYFLKRQLRA